MITTFLMFSLGSKLGKKFFKISPGHLFKDKVNTRENEKVFFEYSYGHNILIFFVVLLNFPVPTSETKDDYY